MNRDRWTEWYDFLVRVASRWRSWLDRLGLTAEDAVGGLLAEKGSLLAERDYSLPQLVVALKHYLIDLTRRRARDAFRLPGPQPLGDPPAPDLREPGDIPAGRLKPQPEAVRLLASLGPRPRGIDLGAALLLSERLKVLRGAAELVLAGDAPPPPSRLAELYYPWEEPEERRAIRAGTPTIGETWRLLAGKVDADPSAGFTDQHVAEALGCTITTWQQWRHRGRALAEERFGEAVVRETVPTWKPRRRGRRS